MRKKMPERAETAVAASPESRQSVKKSIRISGRLRDEITLVSWSCRRSAFLWEDVIGPLRRDWYDGDGAMISKKSCCFGTGRFKRVLMNEIRTLRIALFRASVGTGDFSRRGRSKSHT